MEETVKIFTLNKEEETILPLIEETFKNENIPLEIRSKYDTAYDVYANLPINSKYKYIQNLNSFGDQLLINYELMDLLTYCEEAIGEENIKEIDEVFNGN